MADDTTSAYYCDDGAEFPVEWPALEDAAQTWRRDDMHQPLVAPPLEVALEGLCRGSHEQAFGEAGFQVPRIQARLLMPQGFVYRTGGWFEVNDPEAQAHAVRSLLENWGCLRDIWLRYSLPRIQDGIAALKYGSEDWSLQTLAYTGKLAFLRTNVSMVALIHVTNELRSLLQDDLGIEGESLQYELAQGYPNATLEADQALYDLAQLASRLPSVRDVLRTLGPGEALRSLASISGGTEFQEALADFLDVHGWKAESWQYCAPTWRERPELPLAIVRRFLQGSAISPAEALRQAAARREAIVEDLFARLPASQHDDLRRVVSELSCWSLIREGRAVCQLTVFGVVRHALLSRGMAIARRGSIDEPSDIFFLLPDEVEKGLRNSGADLSAVVSARKAEHAYWQTKIPPRVIGGPQPQRAAIDALPGEIGVLRGLPASRGLATGRAVVAADLEDAQRLQSSDILVCRTTSPAWTPLFALAAAVVTDTGSILSHMAITAREYGIPCVVGTGVATSAIHDGAMITVDGSAGTVAVA